MTVVVRSLHPGRWKSVVDFATELCQAGTLPCVAVATGTKDTIEGIVHRGRQR